MFNLYTWACWEIFLRCICVIKECTGCKWKQQLQALLLRNNIADKIFGEGNLSLGSCSQEDFFIFNLLTVVLLSACYRGRNFVVIYL